jgi:hypothetical protein
MEVDSMIGARSRWCVALLLLFGVLGCGSSNYPVRGKVTFPDGTPLTEGMVVFETKGDGAAVTARGEIQADGSFELGTLKPRDGAPAGTYRVLISPKTDPNAVDKRPGPPPFDPRFTEFATSSLVIEVKAQANDIPITISKLKQTK